MSPSMVNHGRSLTIRDPVWNTIRLDALAAAIIDTPAFQRLRYIRQLGLAHLVYPGATHTRFDHALGVYHLAERAIRTLKAGPSTPPEVWDGARLIPYAALLHDIGHYPFSHAIEELDPATIAANHEQAGAAFFESEEMRVALAPLGEGAHEEISRIITGRGENALRGLVSGSLDLDKMEYLRRDARFCGVPYGEVDVEHLLQGLVLLEDPASGKWEVGIRAKAIGTLESLLFAKYQMFRSVYWHHGVRAATGFYKRIVEVALTARLVSPPELIGPTDEQLLHELDRRARACPGEVASRLADRWLPALRNRRLPKRAVEIPAWQLECRALPDWVGGETAEKRSWEDALAAELDLAPGEVILDFPVKTAMFQLDVLVDRPGRPVRRLGGEGIPGLIDLPKLAEELYRTARVLRLFTFERRPLDPEWVLHRMAEGPGARGGGDDGGVAPGTRRGSNRAVQPTAGVETSDGGGRIG
ncbi:MAG: HD domain-containing protein [Gemmatimonadetes bacterium]|nr:HD domain-containing protein [Gemmatimonadota bacterium]